MGVGIFLLLFLRKYSILFFFFFHFNFHLLRFLPKRWLGNKIHDFLLWKQLPPPKFYFIAKHIIIKVVKVVFLFLLIKNVIFNFLTMFLPNFQWVQLQYFLVLWFVQNSLPIFSNFLYQCERVIFIFPSLFLWKREQNIVPFQLLLRDLSVPNHLNWRSQCHMAKPHHKYSPTQHFLPHKSLHFLPLHKDLHIRLKQNVKLLKTLNWQDLRLMTLNWQDLRLFF